MTFTREQIIAWAREAGFAHFPDNWDDGWWQADKSEVVVRFAALIEQVVRADENEQCARVCEEYGADAFNNDDIICDICADKIRARRNHD